MPSISAGLNERAFSICGPICRRAQELRLHVHDDGSGAVVVDFGVNAEGGLAAGLALARICISDLGSIGLAPSDATTWPGPQVTLRTDHPLEACLASQYAGWRVAVDDFHAMGSGPMRGLTGKEELFKDLGYPESDGYRSREEQAVGVLEADSLPDDSVTEKIAAACDVDVRSLILCVAPTASIAGHIQVVARSVETALHKLHELKFDVTRIVSGFGTAPLPPIAKNGLQGIGRTNDAILYGGKVTLWVNGEDESLEQIVQEVPSCASRDFGRPFGELFASYDHDFYKIDPNLFSPAVIEFVNLTTGHSFSAGSVRPDVLASSFA